jgi:uncharacterized tellurite resistance protein B-like protein
MEAIGSIIFVIIVIIGFRVIVSAGLRTAGAATKAAFGKGTFSENMNLAFKGMGPLEIRLTDSRIDPKDINSPTLKELEGKGVFPVKKKTRVGFITTVFDETSGELEPVISALDAFQEPDSIVYQHRAELGEVHPDQGFVSWVRLGVILPTILQPPYSGERNLRAVLRMVDLNNPPPINHGYHQDHPGLLWQKSLSFTWAFEEKGYSEAAEHRDESLAIALKIGMAVAMADGQLDDKEGITLKQWIQRAIEPFSEDKRNELKDLYNAAMKEAYSQAISGDLNLTQLTRRLNEIGEKTTKYEAVELCFDVMSADGVADKEEMRVIRMVSEALDLDLNEIEKMRDQKIISLDSSVSDDASIEELLDIQDDWTPEQTRRHLRNEFQKWNNRVSTLPEGAERDNAQRMLNLIAEARKKYA